MRSRRATRCGWRVRSGRWTAKRNLLILVARYLQDNGYLQSAETLQGGWRVPE